MRISVLSDTRMPTLPVGGHGLGRVALDLANGLRAQGHEVTLYAGLESCWDGNLITHHNETARATSLTRDSADAWLDLTHFHDLSNYHPDWAVVNYLTDLEFTQLPLNAVIGTPMDIRNHYPTARLLPLGIDVDAIPLNPCPKENYLAFAAKIHQAKGFQVALEVHRRQPIPVRFVGEQMAKDVLPDWQPELTGNEFYNFLGRAVGLLSPTLHGIGGRVPLEAAACGTGTLVLEGNSVADHVCHRVSGYHCADTDGILEAINNLHSLQPAVMREWVAENHSLAVMCEAAEGHLEAVANGERW